MFFRLVPTLILLLTATTASALTIVGFDAGTNNRFSSGYPASPVPNTSPSFLGNGYDLSGVGWNSTNATQSFAMISDRHFVYANHYGPGPTLNFLSPALLAASPTNPAAAVVSASVGGTSWRLNSPITGQAGDFSIGMLATPLDAALGITAYSILGLNTLDDYLNLPVLMYGHSGSNSTRLGQNTLEGFHHGELSPGDGIADSYWAYYDFDTGVTGEAQFEGGDSSSPTFVEWHGRLVLIGTHSAVGSASGVSYAFDNFIPVYLDQMTTLGIDFSVVPEPSHAMLLLLGACALLRRRHRAPRE